MLRKIISGGQTGVDRAALMVAKELGFETGGCMPRSFRAEDGYHPEFAELYGMRDCADHGYKVRTLYNVQESDGTVLIGNMRSRGSYYTLQLLKEKNKPYIIEPYHIDFINFIKKHRIKILNIAGNRESVNPEITTGAILLLTHLLTAYKEYEQNHNRSLQM